MKKPVHFLKLSIYNLLSNYLKGKAIYIMKLKMTIIRNIDSTIFYRIKIIKIFFYLKLRMFT